MSYNMKLCRLFQQAELMRSFQPPPNKCVSDVPEWAGAEALARRGAGGAGGAGAGGGAGGSGKKDGLLQKATRWWGRMGARPPPPFLPASPPPPCVMVPRRAPPPPPPPPDAWRLPPAPLYHITLTFHYRDDQTRRSARASRSIIDLVFIYLGLEARASDSAGSADCEWRGAVVPAASVTSLNTLIGLDIEIIVSIEKLCS